MKNYYRVMLGRQSVHAATCLAGNFIGAHYGILQDLKPDLQDDWREFNKKFIPIYLLTHPEKTKIGAGLACGSLWTVSKGIAKGDIVLCPDGTGKYLVGEVTGDYYYTADAILPHRRPVTWRDVAISRSDMSDALKRSTRFHWHSCKCFKLCGRNRGADWPRPDSPRFSRTMKRLRMPPPSRWNGTLRTSLCRTGCKPS